MQREPVPIISVLALVLRGGRGAGAGVVVGPAIASDRQVAEERARAALEGPRGNLARPSASRAGIPWRGRKSVLVTEASQASVVVRD